MSASALSEQTRRSVSLVEIEKQHGAVVVALDKLFEHEVPKRRSRARLRLAAPRLAALKADQVGEGLRAFIISRGWDLWTFGGHLELFAAVHAVMAARPDRQMWNRTQLTALWGDIGEDRPGGR